MVVLVSIFEFAFKASWRRLRSYRILLFGVSGRSSDSDSDIFIASSCGLRCKMTSRYSRLDPSLGTGPSQDPLDESQNDFANPNDVPLTSMAGHGQAFEYQGQPPSSEGSFNDHTKKSQRTHVRPLGLGIATSAPFSTVLPANTSQGTHRDKLGIQYPKPPPQHRGSTDSMRNISVKSQPIPIPSDTSTLAARPAESSSIV